MECENRIQGAEGIDYSTYTLPHLEEDFVRLKDSRNNVRFPYNPPHDSFIVGGFFKRPEVGKNSTILKRFIRCHLLT